MRIRLSILLLVVGMACTRDDGRDQTEGAVTQFLHAAAAGDSLTVARLARSGEIVAQVKTLGTYDPELLRAVGGPLKMRDANVLGDSAKIDVLFSYKNATDIVRVGLVRKDAGWQVYYLGWPKHM